MANDINCFVDNAHLNSSNSLTHLLQSDDTEELNVIRHSPYISIDELLLSRINKQNGLSILSLNCQSLHAKFDYIKILIEKFQHNNCSLQVICLQESWFSNDTDLSLYMIPGYHLISTGHYASTHGGLVMYLNQRWDYNLKTCDTVSKLWERQIVEIIDPNVKLRKKIIVGNIYRPPNISRESFNVFMEEFNDTLVEFYANNQNTYLCGDYNIDLLKINSMPTNEAYFDNILSSGYLPTITLPTRLSTNSSLIDNVFTTNLSTDLFSCILDIHISDHQPVILFSDDDLPKVNVKYITIKTNTDEARKLFKETFINKRVFEHLDTDIHIADPNQNYNVLENALTESYSACFPERVVRFNKKKHKKTPWITAGILKSINHRNKLYKNFKQTQIDAINYVAKKANFNQYRNRLNKTITLAKRMYYKHIFDQFKYDMKKTWAILSDILNRKAINPLPDMMTIQGHECSDKKVIAEQFNIFFATMGMQNVHRDNVHDRHSFRNYLTHQTETNFSFHMIDNNATVRMIKSMKMSQSKGHDGISSELIKLINTDISSSITVIINQSLTSGIFPDKLKIAKVTPIFKKGNKKLICNYRPISVLPVISKVFETVLQEQLTEYFTTNNLFAPQQYGFRKNSSTELAALELIDRLLNQMNNHKIPTNFYIDLSKAFDSLQHDILLEKLAHYGLTNKAIALLKSYLSNRKQYVQLSDVRSSVRPISVGVPQGSILGPLLFNIFINDIVKSSTKFNFILYADDTTLNSTLDSFGQDAVEIQNTIVSELQNIFKWLDVNRLCLNVTKSKFMLFHMPQKEIPQLSFNINGMVIEHVKEFNFLGLILDSNLNWKAHLKAIG